MELKNKYRQDMDLAADAILELEGKISKKDFKELTDKWSKAYQNLQNIPNNIRDGKVEMIYYSEKQFRELHSAEIAYTELMTSLRCELEELQQKVYDTEKYREDVVNTKSQKITNELEHASEETIRDDFKKYQHAEDKNEALIDIINKNFKDLSSESSILRDRADVLEQDTDLAEEHNKSVKAHTDQVADYCKKQNDSIKENPSADPDMKSHIGKMTRLSEYGKLLYKNGQRIIEGSRKVIMQCRETAKTLDALAQENRQLNRCLRYAIYLDDRNRKDSIDVRLSAEKFAHAHVSEIYEPKSYNRRLKTVTAFFDPAVDLSGYTEEKIRNLGDTARRFLEKERKELLNIVEWAQEIDEKGKRIDAEVPRSKTFLGRRAQDFKKAFKSVARKWYGTPDTPYFYRDEKNCILAPDLKMDDVKSRLESINYQLDHLGRAIKNKIDEKRQLHNDATRYENLFWEKMGMKDHKINAKDIVTGKILSAAKDAYKALRDEKAEELRDYRFMEDCDSLEEKFAEIKDMFNDLRMYAAEIYLEHKDGKLDSYEKETIEKD